MPNHWSSLEIAKAADFMMAPGKPQHKPNLNDEAAIVIIHSGLQLRCTGNHTFTFCETIVTCFAFICKTLQSPLTLHTICIPV